MKGVGEYLPRSMPSALVSQAMETHAQMLGMVRTSGLLKRRNGRMAWSGFAMELNVEMYRPKVVHRVLCVVAARVRTVVPGGGLGADSARI